jgi:hypothetical protein
MKFEKFFKYSSINNMMIIKDQMYKRKPCIMDYLILRKNVLTNYN